MSDTNRRLAAIVFTDMVGYTALMQKDEKLGRQKRRRHREVLVEQHRKYEGEIIQYYGDGTLSLFNNSVDAVSCAIEIQKALRSPIEVPLRIGIHTGQVVTEDDGIIGDAVNIASRIESFSSSGAVLVSDSVHDQIKNQAGWDFQSLGKFHLKNVERPFEIFAIVDEGLIVPDPESLLGKGENIAKLRSTIPTPATALLGRESELQDLIDLLAENKIVTITGPGGMGKTRLALEVCERLTSQFRDGKAFISMATLTDATEVMSTVAGSLDIKEAEGREVLHGIAALISDKKALLVLDNLEHVISAAKEIAELSSICPNLHILCTSRTPLMIKAEQEYPLDPLPFPDTDEKDPTVLMTFPSIRLFVDRASKVNIDFELTSDNASAVADICRRLDGLPLALELAAARIRILPPEKLRQRLGKALDLLTSGAHDLPERQQTLRTTIDWSHSLLNEKEKQLFCRLSVFAGSFTLEAVEYVCYPDEDDAILALDELESLIHKSLVERKSDGRFSLLQTIRDYAAEKLTAAGTVDKIKNRHAVYYYNLSQWLDEGARGTEQQARMRVGLQEEGNIQAALDHLLRRARDGDQEAVEMGLRICGELWMYWHIRGKHVTAIDYISGFWDAAADEQTSLGKCKALATNIVARHMLAQFGEAKKLCLILMDLAQQLGDDLEIAKSRMLNMLTDLFLDPLSARQQTSKIIESFRSLKSDYWMSIVLWASGFVHLANDDLEHSKSLFAESLQHQQKTGDLEIKGGSLSGLAKIAASEGDHDHALELYKHALGAFSTLGDRPEEARVLGEMSWTYLDLRNTEAARQYALDSIQAYREVGSIRGTGLSMLTLAAIEVVEGRPRQALEIASSAEHLARQEGIVVYWREDGQYQEYVDRAKSQLAQDEIDRAISNGRSYTLTDVLQLSENELVIL